MRVSGFVRTTTLEWKGVIASAVTLSEDGDTDTDDILGILQEMKGRTEGVIIGGDLRGSLQFIKQVRSMGYRIRAVTYGDDPDTLDDLIGACYVDSVLMYLGKAASADTERTLSLISEYRVEHEFRIILDQSLTIDDVKDIARSIRGAKELVLMVPEKNAPKRKEVLEAAEAARGFVKNVTVKQ